MAVMPELPEYAGIDTRSEAGNRATRSNVAKADFEYPDFDPAVAGGAGSGGPTRVVQAGSLAASYVLALGGDPDVALRGTLARNVAVSFTGVALGQTIRFILTQTGAGGYTVTISDGVSTTALPLAATGTSNVEVLYDGVDFIVTALGGGSGGSGGAETDAAALAALSAHTGDTVDAHDASAISVVPFSTISATDVQAALAEIVAEIPSSGGVAQPNRIYGLGIEEMHSATSIAWDPGSNNGGNSTPTASRVYINRQVATRSVTLTTVFIGIGIGGTGATALADCYVGVYNAAGTLLGKSADQSASWATAGNKNIAITAESGQSLAVTAGDFIYVAFVIGTQSTTPCQVLRGTQNSVGSFPRTTGPLRFALINVVQATFPATLNPNVGEVCPAWWNGTV